jgi:hypothetical protein
VPVTVSPKSRATTRRRHIPRTFDLLPLPRSVLLRQFCAVFAVLPLAFEHVDIAERACVHEIELENIIAIVERRPWIWPQRRFLVEGYEGAGRRRGRY